MNHLYADVYSPDGVTLQGSGSVEVLSISAQSMLDGAGKVRCEFRLTNAKALALMALKGVVRLYVDDEINPIREVATFVIDNISDSPASGRRTVTGPDVLTLLTYDDSGRRLRYDNQTLTAIVTNLATHMGWTVSAGAEVATQSTSAQYNYTDIYRCIADSLSPFGFHFLLNEI